MNTIRADHAFLEALHCQRLFPDDAVIPLVCWLTPRVPEAIESLIRQVGHVKRLRAGEYVFGPKDRYDAIVLMRWPCREDSSAATTVSFLGVRVSAATSF